MNFLYRIELARRALFGRESRAQLLGLDEGSGADAFCLEKLMPSFRATTHIQAPNAKCSLPPRHYGKHCSKGHFFNLGKRVDFHIEWEVSP
jgi:hypothetical protein